MIGLYHPGSCSSPFIWASHACHMPCGAQATLLRDIEARDARALKASLRAVVLAAPGAPPNSRVRSSAVSAGRQAKAATPSASADSGGMVS